MKKFTLTLLFLSLLPSSAFAKEMSLRFLNTSDKNIILKKNKSDCWDTDDNDYMVLDSGHFISKYPNIKFQTDVSCKKKDSYIYWKVY